MHALICVIEMVAKCVRVHTIVCDELQEFKAMNARDFSLGYQNARCQTFNNSQPDCALLLSHSLRYIWWHLPMCVRFPAVELFSSVAVWFDEDLCSLNFTAFRFPDNISQFCECRDRRTTLLYQRQCDHIASQARKRVWKLYTILVKFRAPHLPHP